MMIIIGIVAVIIIIGVLRAVVSERNRPNMDANGNMRCKLCNGSNFRYWTNKDGSVTYECHSCGKRWTRL